MKDQKKITKLNWFFLFSLFILTILTFNARNDGLLHVYFLDVGQGDSVLTSVTQYTTHLYSK